MVRHWLFGYCCILLVSCLCFGFVHRNLTASEWLCTVEFSCKLLLRSRGHLIRLCSCVVVRIFQDLFSVSAHVVDVILHRHLMSSGVLFLSAVLSLCPWACISHRIWFLCRAIGQRVVVERVSFGLSFLLAFACYHHVSPVPLRWLCLSASYVHVLFDYCSAQLLHVICGHCFSVGSRFRCTGSFDPVAALTGRRQLALTSGVLATCGVMQFVATCKRSRRQSLWKILWKNI